MRRTYVLLSTLLMLALVSACGESDGPTGPGTVTLPNGTFSGTIGSSEFIPTAVSVFYSGDIVAFGAADVLGRSLGWAVTTQGPGTYTIGTNAGANATWEDGDGTWVASAVLGSGSVTLTTLTIGRATGTYTFSLAPLPGTTATGNRNVTGTFNITY